jgi:hypothetical protein
VIVLLTQLYRYTPEIFLFSIATFKYTPSDELDKKSANVALWKFQSLKWIPTIGLKA